MEIIPNNINHHSQITYTKGRFTESKPTFITPIGTINIKVIFRKSCGLRVAFS